MKWGVIKKILIMNRLLDDIYAKSLAPLLNIDFFTILLKKGAVLFSRIIRPPFFVLTHRFKNINSIFVGGVIA